MVKAKRNTTPAIAAIAIQNASGGALAPRAGTKTATAMTAASAGRKSVWSPGFASTGALRSAGIQAASPKAKIPSSQVHSNVVPGT